MYVLKILLLYLFFPSKLGTNYIPVDINMKVFGCVADGETDDSACFNKAIEQARIMRGYIHLGNRSYVFNHPITLDVSVFGVKRENDR